MKKILLILIAALAVVFYACDPMSDINDEIDDMQDAIDHDAQFLSKLTVAPEAYTLTDEDYELSSNESVSDYKNFSSSALPKDFLPEILNQKFSGEDAQSMEVTYNYYSKVVADEDNAYELSNADYESMGQGYHNFEDEDVAEALIAKLLDRIWYVEDAGAEQTVAYTLTSMYDSRYIKINADGTAEEVDYDADAVEVDDDIYEATGNGNYNNFYGIGDALEDLAQYAVDSSVTLPIVYEATIYRSYYTKYLVFLYNGMNWEAKQSVMAVTEVLNYALDENDITQSTWWADPAIKIALGSDDYALFDETSRYNNFDLRSGKTPGPDNDKLVEMIGEMLDENYGAVENQQYLITYAYYDGSNGTANIRIIKTGGVWSEYSEE